MAIDACVRLPMENQCTEHTGTSAPLNMNDELDISHDSLYPCVPILARRGSWGIGG
jgi:hypothetical protein